MIQFTDNRVYVASYIHICIWELGHKSLQLFLPKGKRYVSTTQDISVISCFCTKNNVTLVVNQSPCKMDVTRLEHHSYEVHLEHGRARVAHCITNRWRNVSHYCRPLRLIYVFWAQRSTARCADSTLCIQTRVYSARGKYIVHHWTNREASLRHSSGWGAWSVSLQYRDLRTRDLESKFQWSIKKTKAMSN